MQAEIEAVFLDINKDELRKRLEEFGAELVQPERLMRRTAFDLGRHEFARVRNEGDKVTMTYKCFTDNTITGAKEIKSSLAPNGLYMMNIMGIYNDAANEFLGWEVKTLREVFGVVRAFHSYDKEHFSSDTQQNWIVVATDDTKWNPPKSLYEVKPNLDGAKILTDDYCPVDYLTARLQFVRER